MTGVCELNLKIMTGINFVLNDKGERTALLIDFAQLKQESKNGVDVMEFMEDIKDILAAELSKNKNEKHKDDHSNWEDAKNRLRAKGIVD